MLNKKLVCSALPIIFILIIASFFRLYNLTSYPPSLYSDEAMNGNNALEALSTGQFKIFYPENNGREGLFINIQAAFIKYLGNSPWVLRLPSAIFGILTVLGLYFLAKQLFKNKYVALLSSFFLATSFWHIIFSRIGFRAIMAPLFLIWAIYFLLKTLENKKQYVWAIIGGIFYGLGFYSYIAYRATPLLMIIILIVFWKQLIKNWKPVLLYILIAFIVVLPLGLYFLQNPANFMGRTSQISIFSSSNPLIDLGKNVAQTLGMFNVAGDWNWRHNIAGRPELFWPVGIMFILGLVMGIKELFKKKKELWILFGWLIATAAPVVVSNEGIPHALRSIIMIPPIFIFAGIGGIWLFNFIKSKIPQKSSAISKFIILISLFFISSALIIEAYNSYFIVWGKNPNVASAFNNDVTEMGYELNALPNSLPKYVIVGEADKPIIRDNYMVVQPIMFITDTFTPEKQAQKNIHYIPSNQTAPKGSFELFIK
ncbi:MAG: glycosyltransferase family 39 protein [Candidatus Pacebacteria bacterium]|nr:glycosyltransferase family 39 protein [Candidatus Paceibacterota bacterium]